jgi:LacI family transcriptional regulator
VTIYDVAAAAGVAPSTVSRAFSRPGRVNPQTADRIRRIAGVLGYRVSPVSHPDPTARTSVIAILVSDVTNPFYNEIIGGVEAAAAEVEFTTLLVNTRGSADVERETLERTIPAVEAIVLATTVMSDSTIRVIAKQRPVVVLNRAVSDIPSIIADNPFGTRRAVAHLAELGHHTITYAAGPEASWTDGIRWRSVREETAKLHVQARRIGPFDPTVAGGGAAADELDLDRTTAVIAYNDRMAIGLIRRLTGRGTLVPEDISVVGYDNIFLAELVTPPLTTVAAPLFVMGTVAVHTLLAVMNGAHMHSVDPSVLPSRLVVRGSTGGRRHRRRLHDN